MLCDSPESPYKDQSGNKTISLDEFLWAFTMTSSRSLVFDNTAPGDFSDETQMMMILPLLDMINHSREPNVRALPFHDKVSDQSFVVL